MSETPVEPVVDLAEALNEALVSFTGCVGEALDDICSYGLTIGETYVPFDPDPEDDCEADEVACSQVWVRVMSSGLTDVDKGFGGGCGGTVVLDLEVGVLRCFDTLEDGEAPTAGDVLVAAMQAMTDMQAIRCAALSCEVWESLTVGAWTPTGPLGGQYGGIWTFSVEV